jgi:hypothetical protein
MHFETLSWFETLTIFSMYENLTFLIVYTCTFQIRLIRLLTFANGDLIVKNVTSFRVHPASIVGDEKYKNKA